MSLSILTSIDERNPGAIRLTDDDQIVPLVLSWDAKGARLTGVLPPRDLRGVTRLEFHVPHVSTLSDQDSRIAGVAFRGLEIAPASTEDLDLFDPVPQVAAE